MIHEDEHPGLSLRLFDPDPALVYSIDAVSRLAQLPRRDILIYCRHGLVSPLHEPGSGGYYFDREAIRVLRRIACLQVTHGVNLAGIKLILDLTGQIQRLELALTTMRPDSSSAQCAVWTSYGRNS